MLFKKPSLPQIQALSESERLACLQRFAAAGIPRPHHHAFDPTNPMLMAKQPLDEIAEFFYITQCVAIAGSTFIFFSLGGSPGEWAVIAQRAYKHVHARGSFKSLTMEGDATHAQVIRDFHRSFDLDPDANTVLNAVVAEKDGFASFPIVNAALDFGASIAGLADTPENLKDNITISAEARGHRESVLGGRPLQFQTVVAASLPTLFSYFPRVNFIHSDIQGSEAAVFSSAIEELTRSVGTCCIETHSTANELLLMNTFWHADWKLLLYVPCVFEGVELRRDGHLIVQNPRF